MKFSELKKILLKTNTLFAIVLDNGICNDLIDFVTKDVDLSDERYVHGFDSWIDYTEIENDFFKTMTDHENGIYWDDKDWTNLENITNERFLKDVHFDNCTVESITYNSDNYMLIYLC